MSLTVCVQIPWFSMTHKLMKTPMRDGARHGDTQFWIFT